MFSPPRAWRRPTELARRIARLRRVFPIDEILATKMGPSQITEYFELSFGAYRRRYSKEGSLHLALEDAKGLGEGGFRGQPQRLMDLWRGRRCDTVLELGFGHGFNLLTLGPAMPGTRFLGVDLTPRHVAHVQATVAERGLTNVFPQAGDYHRLPFEDASVDHVYAIEAFCYARDLHQALSEVHRVLRPGGTFTLFDGYVARPVDTMTHDQALTVYLGAKGVALDTYQLGSDIVKAAQEVGFAFEREEVLDDLVLPCIRGIERAVGLFVHWPWLARRLLARLNPVAMRNVLTAYLIGPAVHQKVTTYLQLVLRKPD